MDVIREHLMYKNDPLQICMKQLSCQDQYEFVRIVLESKTEKIYVCKHSSTNKYIDTLLDKLPIEIVKDCFREMQKEQAFVFPAKKVC
jgi:transcriptional antiterminator